MGPTFLQPILGETILTGKSMEMLENLGRMGEVLTNGQSFYERPPSLFELFVRNLRRKVLTTGNEQKDQDKSIDLIVPKPVAALTKPLKMEVEKDTLLRINFAAVFPTSLGPKERMDEKTDLSFIFKRCSAGNPKPLLQQCSDCLYPQVKSRYKTVCMRLVEILKTEYNLMDSIHAMQRYYLMSAGEVMYDFYTPIFKKIQTREPWRDLSLLEMYLHEAVGARFPQDVAKLSVSLSSTPESRTKRPINATDCLHLKYNVPWPVDVVISGRCQELYNQVFTFLMQVKRAKCTLDQLRFEEVTRQQAVPTSTIGDFSPEELMSRDERIHRSQILRFRLLYFVNSLHNYIMTRILHSTGLEFSTRLDTAEDLEQIIAIHNDYVHALHERCLLHKSLAILKETVVKVLNLSLTFSMQWRQGVDFLSGDSIQTMEVELSRCVHFLSSFLNNVTKRGSFPHLESLAFALLSSLQQPPQGPI